MIRLFSSLANEAALLLVFLLLAGCATNGPLITAADRGQLSVVKGLLDNGAPIDERGICGPWDVGGESGATPLFCAAHGGHFELVKELVARGADVNAKGNGFLSEGKTPLMAAVYARHAGIAKFLMENGADVDYASAKIHARRTFAPDEYAFLEKLLETSRGEKRAETVAAGQKLPATKLRQRSATDKEKLAVLDLDRSGVDSDLAYSMSVALRDELHQQGTYQVLSREDLLALAKRLSLQQQAGECADDQCLVSYGKALGTRYMVAGVISKVGSMYSISLRLLDTEGDSAGVVNRANERCQCSQEALFQTVSSAAAKLMGKE